MKTFKEASIKPEILRALEDLNFTEPTPIQAKVLSFFEDEIKDCIALAQTGTGKTAAYSIPILNAIEEWQTEVKALILSPTRELALQIGNDIFDLSKYQKYISNVVLYGGASITQQMKSLRDKPQIVIGTPGRTVDLIKRKKLDLRNVEWIVLDESDEMLSMGFKDDLEFILSHAPAERTILLFSATLAPDIKKISQKYLSDPLEIIVGNKNEGAENVTHKYFVTRKQNKYAALKRLLDMHPDIYSIVFCRTKRETNDVAAKLGRDGYNADTLNGDLSQSQRDLVMQKFRDKQVQILVATDVAARGLDVNDLTHVINYKLPDEKESYVHRSGRTGRAGKAGMSYSIIEPSEIGKIKSIQKSLGKNIEAGEIPAGTDIIEAQLADFIEGFENVKVKDKEIEPFLPHVKKLLESNTAEEIVRKLLYLKINNLLEYYKENDNINEAAQSSHSGSDRSSSGKAFTRFFLNVGKRDRYQKRNMLQLINKLLPHNGIEIGKVEILQTFSFIELEEGYEEVAMKAFRNARLKGRSLSLEIANKKDKKKKNKRHKQKN